MKHKKKQILLLFIPLILLISLIILFTTLFNKKNSKLESTLSTEENKHYYNNPVIPEGFKKVETDSASWNLDEQGNPKGWNDGLVIEDEKGNQFVWIPCTIDGNNETVKYSRYMLDNNNLVPTQEEKIYTSIGSKHTYYVESDPINDEIYKSIEKYQGFYVGRFETGIENGVLLPQTHEYTKENFTLWENGTPVIKPNSKAWNYLTKAKAKEISENFCNSSNVQSSLTTSFCFDTILKWISNEIHDFHINSQNYGNYSRNFYDIKKDSSGHVLTGTEKEYMYKNIYDIAGNMREFTTEVYINDGNGLPSPPKELNVLRENYGRAYGTTEPTSTQSCFSRLDVFKEYYNTLSGFRIILFIK